MLKIGQSTIEKLLYIALFLLVIFGVVIGVLVYSNSERTQKTLYNNCIIGNEFRADNLKLWTYILTIPPSQERTESQQLQVDQFRVVVDKTFEQRDCNNI